MVVLCTMEKADHDNFHHEGEHEQLEQEARRSTARKIVRIAVVLLVIAGLLYLIGFRSLFLYRRTPADVQQTPTQSVLELEEITIPLSVFIVRNDEGNGSERSREDVVRLVDNASRIWQQANVTLTIKDIFLLERTDREILGLLDSTQLFIQNVEEFDAASINVFLTGNLKGINGIAFVGLGSVAVADYTTVPDFRALAHEVGHILGLAHVPEEIERLMYQGAKGFQLTPDEIIRARTRAELMI